MNSLRLEKMKAGELDVDDASRAAVAALAADDARVLARLPPKTAARNIEAALARPSSAPAPTLRLFVAPAVAAAACLAVFVVVPPKVASGAAGDAGDVSRLKGDARPELLLSRQVEGAAVSLSSWDTVKPGDVVQVRTRGAGFAHGVVVSVDGGGHVTRHFPDDGAPTALPSGTTSLPFSFELDDAPGFERFFLVASPVPLDVKAVEAAVAATARSKDPRQVALTGLPTNAVQSDFLLLKGAVPDGKE